MEHLASLHYLANLAINLANGYINPYVGCSHSADVLPGRLHTGIGDRKPTSEVADYSS